MKRLVIVADGQVAAHGVRLALRQTSGFHIVGFVDGRRPVAATLVQARPDVVVVDDMTDPTLAPARLREVRDAVPNAIALLLTATMDDDRIAPAFDAGARAVICKNVHPVSLGTLLREIADGNVVHRDEPRRAEAAECPLTSRELEILRYVAMGHTNSRIARTLWVTEQTVKFHLSNIYRKLNVTNRTEASRVAQLRGLLDPPTVVPSLDHPVVAAAGSGVRAA
jgi:DNA-binding NarL/FixJ family response regulator